MNFIIVISAYNAIGSEIDVLKIIDILFYKIEKDYFAKHEIKLCFPICISGKRIMIFREYIDENHIKIGKFHIREPTEDCNEVTPNLILVPLLSYDKNKNRLGYGIGHYDNTLKYLREEKKYKFLFMF